MLSPRVRTLSSRIDDQPKQSFEILHEVLRFSFNHAIFFANVTRTVSHLPYYKKPSNMVAHNDTNDGSE